MSRLRALLAALAFTVLVLSLVPAALVLTAPRASASVSIYGPCTSLQDGRTIVARGYVWQCRHVRGLGWFYIRIGPVNYCGTVTRLTTSC